jgi:hypothetical protein
MFSIFVLIKKGVDTPSVFTPFLTPKLLDYPYQNVKTYYKNKNR